MSDGSRQYMSVVSDGTPSYSIQPSSIHGLSDKKIFFEFLSVVPGVSAFNQTNPLAL